MDNLRGLLGIWRMDKVPNAWIRELCKVKKGVDERNDRGMIQWYDHVMRIEKDKIAKRVYVRLYAGSRSVHWLQKRWIGTVKKCLKKRDLDFKKKRRMGASSGGPRRVLERQGPM